MVQATHGIKIREAQRERLRRAGEVMDVAESEPITDYGDGSLHIVQQRGVEHSAPTTNAIQIPSLGGLQLCGHLLQRLQHLKCFSLNYNRYPGGY